MTALSPPLRVGIVLNTGGSSQYAWAIVRGLTDAGVGIVVLVVHDDARRPEASPILRLYARWDRRAVSSTDDPLVITRPPPQFEGIATARLHEAHAAVAAARVDVLLDLRELRQVAAPANAVHGIWQLVPAVTDFPALRAVMAGDPLTRLELRARRDGLADERVLGEVVTATTPGLSWSRNRVGPFWTAVPLVIEKLRELRDCGCDVVARRSRPAREVNRQSRSAPSGAAVAAWLAGATFVKAVRRVTRRRRQYDWRMGIRSSARPLIDRSPEEYVQDFRWISSPADRHYADPFLLERDGRLWCFFEDISRLTARGRISVLEVLPDGSSSEPVVALERPYHMSYPNVFADGEHVFMIPETSENGTVELYACTRFPDQWTLEAVLRRDLAVDTTVLRQLDRYWFFTTRLEPRSQSSQLWLYSSSSLTGEWTPHPANPLSMDVRNARGAGAVVRMGERLFRPSQDCSVRYGRAFALNEILMLAPDRYEEQAVCTVEPPPSLLCTHTYARAGSIEMIDVCELVPYRR